LFYLPVQNCAEKTSLLEDLELDELIELDTEIMEIEGQLRQLREQDTDSNVRQENEILEA
jgi:hypothetical protein